MGPGSIPDLGTKIPRATAQPKTNNNTKTMTKKSVWFVVMSLFILGIVNFIYSLLFIGIDQCSSVFNEPCLKCFFLCFLSYAYLLFHSLLFLFYFFKFYFIFKLYIIVLVLPHIKMNPPQVYMCSPSWTLLPPPSPFHPSGSSQCTSPKLLSF